MENSSGPRAPTRPAPFVGGRKQAPVAHSLSQRPRPFSPGRTAPASPDDTEARRSAVEVDSIEAPRSEHSEPVQPTEVMAEVAGQGESTAEPVNHAPQAGQVVIGPDAPSWHVARYEPGMSEDEAPPPPVFEPAPPSLEVRAPAMHDDTIVADEPVVEPNPDTVSAVGMLRSVADRLERGEIQLPPGSSVDSEAAVVAAVLSVLLGANR